MTKVLIRLQRCADWSSPLLFACHKIKFSRMEALASNVNNLRVERKSWQLATCTLMVCLLVPLILLGGNETQENNFTTNSEKCHTGARTCTEYWFTLCILETLANSDATDKLAQLQSLHCLFRLKQSSVTKHTRYM